MRTLFPARAGPAVLRPKPKSWTSAFWVCIGAALVLGIPEVLGRWSVPAGSIWTGSSDVVNYPTYLAKITWGATGHWTYVDTMTPQPTAPAPIYVPYLLLGHLEAWLGGTAVGWFQGARILLAAGAVAMWWAYCRQKWSGPRGTLSFWMGLLATAWWPYDSGTALGRRWAPFDWWPGGHAAAILAGAPHYGIMGICLVGTLWLGERAREGEALAWLPACLAEGALATTYPWLCPLPLLAAWGGVRNRREAGRMLVWSVLAGAGAVPYGLVLLASLRHIAWLDVWRLQSTMRPAPLPVVLGLTYGLTGPLAVLGAAVAAVRRDRSAAEALVWAAAAITASYVVPIPNSREMTILLSLPLGALAAGAVAEIGARLGRWPRRIWASVLSLGLGATALFGVATILYAPLNNPSQPAAVRAAIRQVAAADPGAIVLADPGTSLWIPVWSNDRLRPYIAHPQETLDYARAQAATEGFWTDSTPAQRAAWLAARHIGWVVWSTAANARFRRYALQRWTPWPTVADTTVRGAMVVWSAGGVTAWRMPNQGPQSTPGTL